MNRRQFKRYSVFVETEVQGRELLREGVTINFSLSGVCFCTMDAWGEKTPLSLTFFFKDRESGVFHETVRGEVRWEQKFGRFFMVGVQFPALLNENEHFLILSHIEQAKEYSDETSGV